MWQLILDELHFIFIMIPKEEVVPDSAISFAYNLESCSLEGRISCFGNGVAYNV